MADDTFIAAVLVFPFRVSYRRVGTTVAYARVLGAHLPLGYRGWYDRGRWSGGHRGRCRHHVGGRAHVLLHMGGRRDLLLWGYLQNKKLQIVLVIDASAKETVIEHASAIRSCKIRICDCLSLWFRICDCLNLWLTIIKIKKMNLPVAYSYYCAGVACAACSCDLALAPSAIASYRDGVVAGAGCSCWTSFGEAVASWPWTVAVGFDWGPTTWAETGEYLVASSLRIGGLADYSCRSLRTFLRSRQHLLILSSPCRLLKPLGILSLPLQFSFCIPDG